MKEIQMIRTETMILQPGQVFGLPDNIADQVTRRGSGKLVEKSEKKKRAD
jgi:hypothetical protein